MSELTSQSTEEFALGFSIFDEHNPYSLVRLVESDKLKECFYRLKSECPEMLYADEIDKERKAKPTNLVARLRLSFWDEYERAIQTKSRIKINGFVRAHCDRAYFYDVIMTNNMWMVYIITPPRKYELTMRQILDKANQSLLEILALPLVDENGRPDKTVIAAHLKIQLMADNRVKGSVAQKLQIQQHIVSQQLPPEDEVYERFTLKQLDALQEKIDSNKETKKLLAQLEADSSTEEVVDVE